MPCTSCHFNGTNRLTKFGKDFLVRGDRTMDADAKVDLSKASLGNYASIASKVRFEADKDADPSTKFDVEALSLYSGGPIDEHFSYFFEIYLHERGKEATSGGGTLDTAVREKLAEGYVLYNSAPTQPNFWFVRAGSYTPRFIHQLSTGGRASVSRPRILNDVVGGGNLYTPRDRFYGLAGGFVTKEGITTEFGITNGGGGNQRPNQGENNNAKDVWGTVEYAFDEYGSNVGIYAYSGTYPITGPPAYQDKFSRIGIGGALVRDAFEFSGAYFTGRNTTSTGSHYTPRGWYAELAYNVAPLVTAFARYDSFDNDKDPVKTGGAIGLSYRLAGFGRIVIEGTQTRQKGHKTANGLMIELNWLF